LDGSIRKTGSASLGSSGSAWYLTSLTVSM
jgi:hypothetical protein